MPELPEAETVARTLAPQVCGRRIVSVEVYHAGTWQGGITPGQLEKLQPVVFGTGRRGKLVLLYFGREPSREKQKDIPVPRKGWPLAYTGKGIEEGTVCFPLLEQEPEALAGLAFHLRMTGCLFVYPPGTEPGIHTRVVFRLDDGNLLFFDDIRKFGQVRAVDSRELSSWEFWKKLGPEPLEMTDEAFAARFHSSAAVKSLLLNQSVVAGVGNIYADESLFRAGIRPDAKGSELSPERLAGLHQALVEVLLESIRECGSSIRDYRTARGDVGAFQNKFRVYGRAGKKCCFCGRKLASARIAGRATVFCPHCQRT